MTAGRKLQVCVKKCKNIALKTDGGEESFFVDSKLIQVCRVSRGKRC